MRWPEDEGLASTNDAEPVADNSTTLNIPPTIELCSIGDIKSGAPEAEGTASTTLSANVVRHMCVTEVVSQIDDVVSQTTEVIQVADVRSEIPESLSLPPLTSDASNNEGTLVIVHPNIPSGVPHNSDVVVDKAIHKGGEQSNVPATESCVQYSAVRNVTGDTQWVAPVEYIPSKHSDVHYLMYLGEPTDPDPAPPPDVLQVLREVNYCGSAHFNMQEEVALPVVDKSVSSSGPSVQVSESEHLCQVLNSTYPYDDRFVQPRLQPNLPSHHANTETPPPTIVTVADLIHRVATDNDQINNDISSSDTEIGSVQEGDSDLLAPPLDYNTDTSD